MDLFVKLWVEDLVVSLLSSVVHHIAPLEQKFKSNSEASAEVFKCHSFVGMINDSNIHFVTIQYYLRNKQINVCMQCSSKKSMVDEICCWTISPCNTSGRCYFDERPLMCSKVGSYLPDMNYWRQSEQKPSNASSPFAQYILLQAVAIADSSTLYLEYK